MITKGNSTTISTELSKPFFYFLIVSFILTVSDAVLSYFAPVYIENHTSNTLIMGFIIAASSLFGFIFDFIAGIWLNDKKFTFFMKLTILLSVFFPLSLWLLPGEYWVFILAMAIWGLYYETLAFAHFNFVKEYETKKLYTRSWGAFGISNAVGYLLGPLIATWAIDKFFDLPFIISVFLTLLAAVVYFAVYEVIIKKHSKVHIQNPVNLIHKKFSIFSEFDTWKIFLKRLWPFYAFTVALVIVDSFFWTTGIIFAEELKETTYLGHFVVAAHTAPSIFMGLVVSKISNKFGKKKTAFYSGLVASVLLFFVGFLKEPIFILGLIFLSSIFSSLAFPSVWATYEDYVDRVEDFNNDLIGLEQSARSVAYIIGPILAGFLSITVGNQMSFSIISILLYTCALLCITMVPKKIKMPQKELLVLEQNEIQI